MKEAANRDQLQLTPAGERSVQPLPLDLPNVN
jgi:hypothetical protein